jgi:hypothetical protein
MPIGISLDAYQFSPVLDMVSRSGYSSPHEARGLKLLVGPIPKVIIIFANILLSAKGTSYGNLDH